MIKTHQDLTQLILPNGSTTMLYITTNPQQNAVLLEENTFSDTTVPLEHSMPYLSSALEQLFDVPPNATVIICRSSEFGQSDFYFYDGGVWTQTTQADALSYFENASSSRAPLQA
jgi:hypothetical protein